MSQTKASPSAFVITGASTGIGRACALDLDRRGFRVFAGVRTESAAKELRAEASPRLEPLMLDVTDAGMISAAAARVTDAVGNAGIAGLVNNAGIAVAGPLEAVPIDLWRRQFEVNVIGSVAVTQAFLPLLRKGRGRVVNISSVSGGIAAPGFAPYAASKWALEAITDSLRVELRRWGIGVSSVEPGPIDTPIWEKSTTQSEEQAKLVSPDILALYEPELDALRRVAADSVRNASPVSRVVRAVVHALTADRPKTRYFLGWNVRFCFKGMKMLPDRARDWIVCKLLGLP